MLEKLEHIPWNQLVHAQGWAEDIPALIKQLLDQDPQKRQQAFDRLKQCLIHEKTRWQATPHALPFLLEVLLQIPEKEELLYFILELALGHRDGFLPHGIVLKKDICQEDHLVLQAYDQGQIAELYLHADWDELEEEHWQLLNQLPELWACQSYQALEQGLANIIEIINLGQTKEAMIAIYILAWFPPYAETNKTLLSEILIKTTDPYQIANILLTLGLLNHYISDQKTVAYIKQYTESSDTLIKIAANIALIEALPHTVSEYSINILLECLVDYDRSQKIINGYLPWASGDLLSYIGLLLVETIDLLPIQKKVIIIDKLNDTLKNSQGFAALLISYILLDLLMGEEEKDPLDIDPLQLKVLETLVDHNVWWLGENSFNQYCHLIASYGLPDTPEAFKQFVKKVTS